MLSRSERRHKILFLIQIDSFFRLNHCKLMPSSPLAKLFVFTKNEYDLIDDFITYHAQLFGFDNIIVIDNGSDNADVLRAYDGYKARGVTVLTDDRPLSMHCRVLTEHMRRYVARARFLIPLDTDEFIVLDPVAPATAAAYDNGDSGRFRKKAAFRRIRDEFAKCCEENHDDRRGDCLQTTLASPSPTATSTADIVRFREIYQSVPDVSRMGAGRHKHARPAREIRTFAAQGWDKVFFRAATFDAVYQGNHGGVTRNGGTTAVSPALSLLHFHNTGKRRQFERCQSSISGYRQLDVGMPLDKQLLTCEHLLLNRPGMFGGHRIEQYYAMLCRIFVAKIHAQAHGGRVPTARYISYVMSNFSVADTFRAVIAYVVRNPEKENGTAAADAEDERDAHIRFSDSVFAEDEEIQSPSATCNNCTEDRRTVVCCAVADALVIAEDNEGRA